MHNIHIFRVLKVVLNMLLYNHTDYNTTSCNDNNSNRINQFTVVSGEECNDNVSFVCALLGIAIGWYVKGNVNSERVALCTRDLSERELKAILESKMAPRYEELNEELDDQDS